MKSNPAPGFIVMRFIPLGVFVAVVLPLDSSMALRAEPPTVVRAEPLPEWTTRFTSRTEGWIGGDGAYSVPLAPTRTLWFFGDTWVGEIKNKGRAGASMVNNSLAIQTGAGADATLRFPIPRDKTHKPLALFKPTDGRGYFWPQAGAGHEGRLTLFLTQVESTQQPGAFGFRLVDQCLAEIRNPDADPLSWQVERKRIPHCEFSKTRTRCYGSAMLLADGFFYLYGIDEPARAGLGGKRLIVARVAPAKVGDFTAWRFLKNGQWQADPAAPDALATGVANECSVSYLPRFKQYALVYTENGVSDRIVARFAPAPEGPWSKAALLFTCPEMKSDKGVFSYAAKAHPHLAKDNELVVSYCVNAFNFWRVAKDASLYWPTFVRVELK